jgi:hypothetical protein
MTNGYLINSDKVRNLLLISVTSGARLSEFYQIQHVYLSIAYMFLLVCVEIISFQEHLLELLFDYLVKRKAYYGNI